MPSDSTAAENVAPEGEVRRALERLRLLIYVSPLSQRQVEKNAGFSRGYLSQLICGNIDLKFGHLIRILDATGIDPGVFFADLYPRRPPRTAALAPVERRAPAAAADPSRLQLARLYGLGLESLEELYERLDRCEDAFSELEAMGILRHNERDR